MKTLKVSVNLLLVVLLLLAFSSVASAQATRTWVSGVGDDANPCSRTAPCKTFAGAISKTATGGEIDCLDPGGFGVVTITKSITIDCDSGPGGVLSAGAPNGIVINGAGATVTLRSINMQGVGTGTNGINILSAAAVHIVDMNIYGYTGAGITTNVSAVLFLTVEDTRIHDCGSGIVTSASGANVVVAGSYNRISLWNNAGSAIDARNGSRLTVNEATFFASNVGINQTNLAGTGSSVTVVHSVFEVSTALQSIAGASIGASQNTFSQTITVFNPNGGSISSGGDNVSFGNNANGVANGPAVSKI